MVRSNGCSFCSAARSAFATVQREQAGPEVKSVKRGIRIHSPWRSHDSRGIGSTQKCKQIWNFVSSVGTAFCKRQRWIAGSARGGGCVLRKTLLSFVPARRCFLLSLIRARCAEAAARHCRTVRAGGPPSPSPLLLPRCRTLLRSGRTTRKKCSGNDVGKPTPLSRFRQGFSFSNRDRPSISPAPFALVFTPHDTKDAAPRKSPPCSSARGLRRSCGAQDPPLEAPGP